jgi:hypothetical protein
MRAFAHAAALLAGLAVVAAGATTAAVTQAEAARKATPKEGAAIRALITPSIPAHWKTKTVIKVRISTVNSQYALATAGGKRGYEDVVQGAFFTLKRRSGVWKVLDSGSTGLGCALPGKVARDLLGELARDGC